MTRAITLRMRDANSRDGKRKVFRAKEVEYGEVFWDNSKHLSKGPVIFPVLSSFIHVFAGMKDQRMAAGNII